MSKPENPIEKPDSVKKPEYMKEKKKEMAPCPPFHRWYEQVTNS